MRGLRPSRSFISGAGGQNSIASHNIEDANQSHAHERESFSGESEAPALAYLSFVLNVARHGL